jgi:5-methylcytosine-specific restriction protein B
MYLLEYREKDMPLAGGTRFSIPANVLIIGTMNTADRSIALVDFALRRRFAFFELFPEYEVLKTYQLQHGFNSNGLVRALQDINIKINDKNFHLGISFFMVDELAAKLEDIWKMEIETYLEEYFFSQPDVVSNFRWDKMKDKFAS